MVRDRDEHNWRQPMEMCRENWNQTGPNDNQKKFLPERYFLPGLFWLPGGLTFSVVSGILSLP